MVGEDLLKCVHTHTDTQKKTKQYKTKIKPKNKQRFDVRYFHLFRRPSVAVRPVIQVSQNNMDFFSSNILQYRIFSCVVSQLRKPSGKNIFGEERRRAFYASAYTLLSILRHSYLIFVNRFRCLNPSF